MPATLPSWSTAANQIAIVGTLGLAPSCRNGNRFTGGIGVSTVNVPLGWPAGLAPACSRFTTSCLDYFGIDHSPPGRNRTFTFRLSGECTTLVLQAGSQKIRRVKKPDLIQRLSHHTAARAPREESGEAGHQRIERCSPDLESRVIPDGDLEHALIERGVFGRNRTSASDLRSVVSRSADRIHGPSDWNRTSDNVVVGHVLCS